MSGLEICQSLKLVDSLQGVWPFEHAQEVRGDVFPGACVMNAGSHRVLVWPDPSKKYQAYQLYSCLLQGSEQICLFEKRGLNLMLDAVVGSMIMLVATSSLLFAIEVAEQAINQSGRYPLSSDEKAMLKNADITADVVLKLQDDVLVVPQEVGSLE